MIQIFIILSNKYKKHISDVGLDSLNTASKKIVHKTEEFLKNKIPDTVTNSYDNKIVKTKTVEEVIIPQEKRKEMSNELRIKL